MDVTIDNLNLVTSTGAGIDVLSASNTQQFNLRLLNSTVDERVAMSHTGTNAYEVLLDNNTITTSGTDVALAFSFTGLAQDGDITIRNGNTITAANASAMTFTATATNADVEFASDGNMFTNNSASNAANFLVNNGAVLNATLTNSSYTNPSAAAFAMTSDGMTTHINLDLTGNTSNNTYELTTMNQGVPGTDFNFSVVDRDNTAANNAGTVNFNPAIGDFENITGPVELPTVP